MTEEQRRWLLIHLNNNRGGGTNSGGGKPSIMTDYLTRLAAEGGSLTAPEIVALNLLTQNADIGEFDRLWIHGLSNQIAARISLVNALTADLITNVNSTTFTAGQGFTGNGTTMYLDTNYNPSIQGVKYTLNSASFGAYSNTNINDNKTLIGTSSAAGYSFIYSRYLGNALFACQQITDSSVATGTDSGFYASQRISNTTIEGYKNGVLSSFPIATTGLIENKNFYICANNYFAGVSELSQNRIALSFIGSGAIDQVQFYTDVQTLGTTLGWAV